MMRTQQLSETLHTIKDFNKAVGYSFQSLSYSVTILRPFCVEWKKKQDKTYKIKTNSST